MDISALSGVSSEYLNVYAKRADLVESKDDSFGSILSDMIAE